MKMPSMKADQQPTANVKAKLPTEVMKMPS